MTTDDVAVPAHPPENETPDPDTEAKLARLFEVTQQKATLEEEREKLRDELAEVLAEDGPRYFIDPDGNKRYGFRMQPEPVEVNVELLASYVSEEVLDEVTERKIKTEAFKQAVKTQRIPAEVFVRVAKKKKQKAQVRFGDPSAPPSPYAEA